MLCETAEDTGVASTQRVQVWHLKRASVAMMRCPLS